MRGSGAREGCAAALERGESRTRVAAGAGQRPELARRPGQTAQDAQHIDAAIRLEGDGGDGRQGAVGRIADDPKHGKRQFVRRRPARGDMALHVDGNRAGPLAQQGFRARRRHDFVHAGHDALDHPQLAANASGVWGAGQTNLDATLRAGDLGFAGRGFGGVLDAQIKVADGAQGRSFDVTGTAEALRVGNAQADAALAGQTRLNLQVVQDGGRYAITRMQAENPQVQVDGQGVIGGGQTDFTAQAVSRNLGFLGKGYGGTVQAGIKLRDQGGLTHFDVTGTGTNISAGSAQLNSALRGDTTFVARGTRAGALIRLDQAEARNGQITATARVLMAPVRPICAPSWRPQIWALSPATCAAA